MSIDVAKVQEALRGNGSIHAWSLRHSRTQAVQTYLLAKGHESERQVDGESLEVVVHLRHDGVQGQTKLTLHGGEESKVAALLDQAVYMAGLGGDEPFDLVGAGAVTNVPLSDGALGSDSILATSRGFADRWIAAVAKLDGGARPSSGELLPGAHRDAPRELGRLHRRVDRLAPLAPHDRSGVRRGTRGGAHLVGGVPARRRSRH
ncbi:MAG: hypothetical protein U0527_09830 [Candidatus Eisenbacteria bacterium]